MIDYSFIINDYDLSYIEGGKICEVCEMYIFE